MVDDFTCRWRPSKPCHVQLEALGINPDAKLLLRFWPLGSRKELEKATLRPAWDPVRVPKTQQWLPKRPQTTAAPRLHPERKEGLLLKKSKGRNQFERRAHR